MNEKLVKHVATCPNCGENLSEWFKGNFKGKYFISKIKYLKPKYFCTKDCYENYKKKFVVEVYNDTPIYCIEVDGEKRYMPYFESDYYFTNIKDCKKRMDMKNVAVINKAAFGFMWRQQF